MITREAAAEHLNEYLDDNLPGDEELVADDMHADRLLARLAELEASQRARETAANEQLEKINSWLAETGVRTRAIAAAIEEQLAGYLHSRSAKSLRLPTGRIGLRKLPAKWHWPDDSGREEDAAIFTYARAHFALRVTIKADGADAMKAAAILAEQSVAHTTEESLDKPAIKARCLTGNGLAVDIETGEVVPGVVVEDDLPPMFYWRAEGRK